MSDPLGLFTQESNDPLGLFAENDDNFATKALKEAGSATSWGSAIPGAAEALTGGVGAMANMAVSGIAGPVKSLFTGKSAADEIGNISHSIEQAIPYMPETDAGKAYLNLLSLPVEGIHKLGEKAFDATGSPLVGAGVETVGNAALLALGARRGKKAKGSDFDTKLKTTMEEKPAPPIDTMQQHELFDQPEMGRVANPYEAKLGDWRVDENGIPIKADLSMDVQNAQNPLQRNLWGDELEQTRSPVGQNASLLDVNGQQEGIPLTQAIDSMDWAHRRGAIKNELTGEVEPTGELLSSINEANSTTRTNQNPFAGMRGRNQGRGSQTGAINISEVKDAIDGFKRGVKSAVDVLKSYKGAFTSNELSYMMEYMNNPKSRTGVVLLSPDEFHHLAAERSPHYLSNTSRSEGPEFKRMKIREGLKSSEGLKDIPWLRIDTKDGTAKVTGHEGRHRMDVFKEMGIDKVPVLITDSRIRWGEGVNEYNSTIPPTKIIGENKHSPVDMPEILNKRYDKNGIALGSQRGAVDPDLLTFGLASKLQKFMENRASKEGPMISSLKDKQAKIEEIVGKPIFAEPPKAESIVADSLASGKDGKGLNSMEAGSTLTAAKRNSPLVQGVSRTIQHAKNLSEYAIRETVFPVEKKLRALSSNEIIQLGKVMKAEMFNRRRLSTTELADLGLSEKQLLAYESVREMFSKALERENAAREAQGLKPITENEAYLSSRWKGDFRRAVHDANGKLVWYLAADSKMGLNKQTKALLKEFPDLVVKPNSDHTVRSHVGSNMNAGEMYSTMVDVLGRDDPAVARIQEWVQEQAVNEGRGMLAQEKHFKSKSNVRGFVGDRPSNTFTGKLDPQKEALDLFQEQITYSKNAHKWSGMQEAGQELKKIFSNKELADQQPNNMAYAKDYYRNQIGLSTHKAVAGLEDAIRQTGISPHVLNRGISNVKSLWITQKLAASVGFAASNIIQAANMLPHIADLMVKYGGNPLSAIATGISTGPLMALGHVSIARGEKGFYKFLGVMPKAQGEFLAKAMKYAEDNSVTARSVYDETPIASSFSKMAKVEQIAGKTLTAPETLLRSVSYMTYVEMLKSSGKFKNDLDIFRMAEERVNMSMADYRQGERAMLFDKMGTTGNMMNTLQTFPINFYQQWSWAAREAKKGNPLPAATMFAVQAYVAGAMGIPGFADTDKLWNAVKGLLADHFPGQWDKVKDIDLKQIVLNSVGEAGLYGGLSEQSGVSFTSRASAPAGSEMLTSPLGPYADLGRQAMDVAGMVADPNKQSFAQAAMSVAPTGLQGALETGPLQDQTSVLNEQTGQRVYGSTRNLADRKGMVSRTPEEETIRKWGLRSQREVVEKDAAYRASKLESDSRTVIASLPSKIYNELRNNRTEKAKDLIGLYSRLSGKEITTEQIQNEAMKEYTTAAQRASMNATTIPGMLAIKRLQQIQQQK